MSTGISLAETKMDATFEFADEVVGRIESAYGEANVKPSDGALARAWAEAFLDYYQDVMDGDFRPLDDAEADLYHGAVQRCLVERYRANPRSKTSGPCRVLDRLCSYWRTREGVA